MKNYIKCINVNFESSVVEDFYGEQSGLHGGIENAETDALQTSSSQSRG
jgi:ketol-acid reductoisomerase